MHVMIPVAPGELVDKITILRIKAERITDASKLDNVKRELALLEAVLNERLPASETLDDLTETLQSINETLWDVEDDIRDCERASSFGEEFVSLARAVYVTNDRRAELKREINTLLGSTIIEEKSYAAY
jgi:predicted  nucleic acid-binding Zn-ribbon protein